MPNAVETFFVPTKVAVSTLISGKAEMRAIGVQTTCWSARSRAIASRRYLG
jgi:hypothetical protein